MKKIVISIVIVIVLAAVAFAIFGNHSSNTTTYTNPSANQQNVTTTTPMTISSSVFSEGQPIPKKYTCDGDNTNPPLQFGDVPQTAQTLALIVDDPDAPNGTWTHWVMWNIPNNVVEIPENAVPSGAVQGQASSGQNNYGGPCPPSGTHHYYFKLYALDSKLSIPSYSDVKALTDAMQGHVVEQSQLVGTYSRGQ